MFARNSTNCRIFYVDECPTISENMIDFWVEAAKVRSQHEIKVIFKTQHRVEKDLTSLPINLNVEIN